MLSHHDFFAVSDVDAGGEGGAGHDASLQVVGHGIMGVLLTAVMPSVSIGRTMNGSCESKLA